jgi:hypothetical protein
MNSNTLNYSKKLKRRALFQGEKFQEPVPEETPFPCGTSPGSPGEPFPTRPNSVHKLRPGDINVVGAMGDSITAANGAASVNLLQGLIENRGLSFAIGEKERGPIAASPRRRN